MNKKILHIIYISLLLFIVHSSVCIDNCYCQWYQVNLPVSGSVNQMQFINSNTGWVTISQTNYGYILLRTTNTGTNWFVIYSDSSKVGKFQFINDSLGYAMGYSHGYYLMSKTTNSGYNWTVMQSSESYVYSGFYMINADTGWVSAFHVPSQVTLRTTNGFQALEQISSGGGGTPAKLYFFKEKINGEYCGYISGAGTLFKTTNGAYNWQQINFNEAGSVNNFSFINLDTGFVVFNPNIGNNTKIFYTSNSGLNWIQCYYYNYNYGLGLLQAVNNEKIWCGGDYVLKSTNGGINWGRQSCPINYPSGVLMYDTILGFAWNIYNSNNLVRTTNGGGPINSIEKISVEIPSKCFLKQNYPNPFNPTTTIEFDIPKTAIIKLTLYDILGKEVINVIDTREINSGSYKIGIDLNNFKLSSGIYFYKLIAFEKETNKVSQISKKMIYNK